METGQGVITPTAGADFYARGAYHQTRFNEDPRRRLLWTTLWEAFFRPLVSPDDCVLELGAGYGHFINAVVARRRIAIDMWEGFTTHLAPGVEGIVGSVTDLAAIDDGAVDFCFASNLFEHLTQAELAAALDQLARKLSGRGTLTILQPNYRYAFREYFDDYTHVSVFSHLSLADFLAAHGFEVIDVRPRFLPLTVKSRLPISAPLIRAYLASPIKPMGKQMLLRARPRRR